MREILFRGKQIDNGKWVEGYLICDREHYGKPDHHSYIVNHHHPSGCFGRDVYIEVDPSTVGQYTGLNDRNGVRIFEGDIIFVPRLEKVYEVKYQRGQYCIGINQPIAYERHSCEVVGNIHDNPELLEV